MIVCEWSHTVGGRIHSLLPRRLIDTFSLSKLRACFSHILLAVEQQADWIHYKQKPSSWPTQLRISLPLAQISSPPSSSSSFCLAEEQFNSRKQQLCPIACKFAHLYQLRIALPVPLLQFHSHLINPFICSCVQFARAASPESGGHVVVLEQTEAANNTQYHHHHQQQQQQQSALDSEEKKESMMTTKVNGGACWQKLAMAIHSLPSMDLRHATSNGKARRKQATVLAGWLAQFHTRLLFLLHCCP